MSLKFVSFGVYIVTLSKIIRQVYISDDDMRIPAELNLNLLVASQAIFIGWVIQGLTELYYHKMCCSI